jgi:hypothetical protein
MKSYVCMFVCITILTHSSAATLIGSFVPLPAATNIDLSAEGSLDWAHWGLTSPTDFNHLNSTNQFIGDYALIGSQFPSQANSYPNGCSWTNGTPVANASGTTTAVYVIGVSNGFQIVVAADASTRRLRLYLGALAGQAQFEASLSSGGAASYLDTSLDSSGLTNGVYVVDFAGTASGQAVTVNFTLKTAYDPGSAAAVLQAATLAMTPNLPPIVDITDPTNEVNYLIGSPILLKATASDPDGTIAQVEFFDGNNSLGLRTNALYQVNWTNAAAGIHSLTAVATDNLGASTISQPVTVFVYTGLGMLTGAESAPTNSIDLAAEGIVDWAHWGLFTETSFDHKAGVAQQISDYSQIGGGQAYNFSDNFEGYSWIGGTPTASATNSHTGIYAVGLDTGFQITATADTTVRTLRFYVGTFAARGHLQAYLNDFSAAAYVDSAPENLGNGPSAVYTISYRAASPGSKLVLRYTVAESFDHFGNVTLQAATLSGGNAPPSAFITSPTNQTALVAPANVTIHAEASDLDGSIAKVEFYQGTTKIGQVTNSPYNLLWTNVPVGNYSLTVRATDNQNATFISSPVNLYVITGGGFLSGVLAAPPSSIDLSAEGTLDWGHWGLLRFNSFNHKLGGTQVNDVISIGTGNPSRYTNNAVGFSWTNGTPVLATNTATGIFMPGLSDGFQFSVPADTTRKRLKISLGLFGAQGRFEASLSDFSAPPFIDDSLSRIYGDTTGLYTLDFSASSSGKVLNVTYTSEQLFDPIYGNVTWQAATLRIPLIVLSNPQSSGAQFSFLVTSEFNAVHDVEYSSSLSGPWLNLTNFVGTAAGLLITDPAANDLKRFYRVRLE